MKYTLFFFTNSYPYGVGENFIDIEIDFLSKSFKKIYIFPLKTDFKEYRETPSNVEIIDIISMHKVLNVMRPKWFFRFKNYWMIKLLNKDLFRSFIFFKKNESRQKLINIKWLTIRAQIFERWLRENKIENGIYYSYWFNDWATILALLRSNKRINKFVSRAHGYDLYKERNEKSFKPFRKLHIKQVDKIYLISKHGKKYLEKSYPDYNDKMVLSYLGTKDFGINTNIKDKDIHMVSVSNIIPVKRIHLIIELLKYFKCSIIWSHFGGGYLHNEIKHLTKALPTKIQIIFKGEQENIEIMKFLKNESITFFINTSESEGLPVSMMEAISFGIPVIGPDVGGISEIVNSKTGLLIQKDFNPENIANQIEHLLPKFNNFEFRKGIREFWLENFKADINYTNFINDLTSF